MTALSSTASFESCVRVKFPRTCRWYAYLWHEWIVESRRPIAPAFARPNPAEWNDNQLTAAWLGHATVPALTVRELPEIDIVLLSHAHFDHFDMRTLRRFDCSTTIISAPRTNDLLRWKRFRDVSELRWK